jgi:hypothetical protein
LPTITSFRWYLLDQFNEIEKEWQQEEDDAISRYLNSRPRFPVVEMRKHTTSPDFKSDY